MSRGLYPYSILFYKGGVQMAGKYNATCSICDTPYYVCMSCKDSMQLQPWKIHCCSADCYKVFQVVRGFSTKVYTKDEFRTKLQNIDLSNLENYRAHIKTLIKDALKNDEFISDIVQNEEKMVVKKPVNSRKRNYKVEVE